MDHIQGWARTSRKHYHQLAEVEFYAWVEGYLKKKPILSKISELKNEKRSLKKATLSVESLRERLKKSYQSYLQRRQSRILNILEHGRNSHDPLSRLERKTDSYLDVYVFWDEIEEALSLMNNDSNSVISYDEREKQLESIDRKLAKARSDLIKNLENYGSGYLQLEKAELVEDIRDTFVNDWRSLQEWCSDPVNPLGFHIRFSPEAEQKAFEALDIISARQPKAKKLAAVKEQ